MQIETLHHADEQKTETYILDLLAWLNYLASRSKPTANGGGVVKPAIRSASCSSTKEANEQSTAQDTSVPND